MNSIYTNLLESLRCRFPEVENVVFQNVIIASLNKLEKKEDLNSLSQETADEIRATIESLDEKSLEEWHFGLMIQKPGEFQNLLKERMFEGVI